MLEGRREKRKGKGKDKGKRERDRETEGGREEGKDFHLPVTEIPENLPKRITVEVIVLLLFVENATQNDSYFFNGRSSEFDPLLMSYLTFFTDFAVLISVCKESSITLLHLKSCLYQGN